MSTVYIGIDWSEKKHDLCFLNQVGEVIQIVQIEQTPEGYLKLDAARRATGVQPGECVVGIETNHTVLIDYLIEQGYNRLYILPPNTVKSAQGRYRQSGAKSDQSDARLIADMLRTDGSRYHAWVPDSQLTCQIRAKVSLIEFLNKQIWQTGNRLRAVLLRYYPGALEIFSSLDSLISLAWILAYPTPQAAQAVKWAEFQSFARAHHHPQPKKWAACYARVQLIRVNAASGVTQTYAKEAQLLAELMREFVQSRTQWLNQLGELFAKHDDYPLYHSLPAAGAYLEPALLAKLGDDRQRFPSPQSLQALAGTCPITKQSGKSRVVAFRRGCDHEFRQIVQQWAKLSIRQSPWAAGYYQTVRPHCSSENEAYRKLANRWLEVLWKLWQTNQPYNEQKHLNAHAHRIQPKS
jgi:transposase